MPSRARTRPRSARHCHTNRAARPPRGRQERGHAGVAAHPCRGARGRAAPEQECSSTDPAGRWYWRWAGTSLTAQRGLWAMGEAIIDAVATRFPAAFEFPLLTSANDERCEDRA